MKGRYYCEEHMSPTYQDIVAEKFRFERKEIKGNKKGNHDIGVIAQEVEKVIPEIVYSKKDIDGGDVKAVDYQKLTAVLIEAVKELSQEVTELKKQINS